MKIHPLTSPPGGITFETVIVEEVSVQTHGTAKVRFRTADGSPLTIMLDFSSLSELPAPGDPVNVSLWRQT